MDGKPVMIAGVIYESIPLAHKAAKELGYIGDIHEKTFARKCVTLIYEFPTDHNYKGSGWSRTQIIYLKNCTWAELKVFVEENDIDENGACYIRSDRAYPELNGLTE